jgi:hypothetical protein
MTDYELMTEADYASLPDDPEGQFVALEAICRRGISKLINQETSNYYDSMVRLQYMSTVFAAAQELGISGLHNYEERSNTADAFDNFLLSANAVVTKIRLRKAGSNSQNSVRLSNRSRSRIEMQVEALRALVRDGDFPEHRKDALLRKLGELSEEIFRERVSFSRVMAIIAYVSAAIGGTTSFLASAPDAITTIVRVIGEDKEAEEAEAQRLGSAPKPRVLPSPSLSKPVLPPPKPASRSSDLDDDIPF